MTPPIARTFLHALVLMLVAPGLVNGQRPSGAAGLVSGIVHSETDAPLPSASVGLRRSADSVLVAERNTAPDGAFRFEGMAPGSYMVEVSLLGYRSAIRKGVAVRDFAEPVHLGVIRLEPRAIALEGIEVSTARPSVIVLPDRNVYSTRDLPAAAGGRAIDVLRSVPELEVDVDGSVTTGGAAPNIHINGRPAPMQGEALARYLQQLPAGRIDRIEVIANPSARYEADGQGIVNIVMKRDMDLGISGDLSVDFGTGGEWGGSGSVNYQEGRFTLFAGASANFFGNERQTSQLRQNLAMEPATFIQQDSRSGDSGKLASGDLTAEMKLGARGMLAADLTLTRNVLSTDALSAYTHLDHLSNPTQRYDRLNQGELGSTTGSWMVGYSSVADRVEWSIEARRTFNHDDDTKSSIKFEHGSGLDPSDPAPELTWATDDQERDGYSLEANLMRAWGESGRVEGGYRGSWQDQQEGFYVEDDTRAGPALGSTSEGDFLHKENIHAGFLTASGELGRFRVQLGVRGEKVEVVSALPTAAESYETGYEDFFPSASIATGLGRNGQIRLSYSRRVNRPRPALLNPASLSLDPLNRDVGNPSLMPSYTHYVTLNATRTGRLGSLQLSPFFRRTRNDWEQVRAVDEVGASTVTWKNVATTTSYGGSITASLAQLGPVGGFVSFRGSRDVRDASNLEADFSGSSSRYSLIGNINVVATATLSLQGTLTYLPARDLPQGTMSPMVFSTIGLRQEFGDGRGAINLSVVDPFELQRFEFMTRDGSHLQTGNSSFSARRATIGISYTFGRPPQSTRPRGNDDREEVEPRTLSPGIGRSP